MDGREAAPSTEATPAAPAPTAASRASLIQAVTLGFNNNNQHTHTVTPSPPGMAGPSQQPAVDAAQLQQLVQLLGAKMQPKQTAIVECPKSMVGRVIGKGGETIKALQQYTGAMIQIDQSTDPTRVTIAGSPQSLQLAVSMVNDIVRGTFKGFAMLRQIAISTQQQAALGQYGQPPPVYVQGYGFVPPSQVFSPEEALAASLMQSTSPTGPVTPPMSPLRGAAPPAGGAGNMLSALQTDALAALLSQQAGSAPPQQQQAPQGSQGALLGQLMQLAAQQAQQQQAQQQQAQQAVYAQQAPMYAQAQAADVASLQALLAQTSLLGSPQGRSYGSAGSPPPGTQGYGYAPPPPAGCYAPPPPASGLPDGSTLSGLLSGTGAAASYLGTYPSSAASYGTGSGHASPTPTPQFPGLCAAANPAQTHRSCSPGGSPGRFGAVGAGLSPGRGPSPAADGVLAYDNAAEHSFMDSLPTGL